jgi:hypothetical protein
MLAVLFVVVAGFCASWNVPVSILERSGGLRGGFGRAPGPIIQGFSVLASLHCVKTPESQKLQFFLGFSYVFRILHAWRIYKKRRKIDSETFRKALLTKTAPKSRPGCPRARFWRALGFSRALLGRLLGGSWLLLAGSWAFLGASWAPLGRLLVALGCLLVPKTGSGSILTGSGGGQGDFGRSLGPTFRPFFVHAR